METQVPASVNLLSCGRTAAYFGGKARDRFTLAINDAHWQHQGFVPDVICAMDDFDRDAKDVPWYVERIVEAGCPVLTTEAKPNWPSCEPYPLKEVLDFLHMPPEFGCKIFSNTNNYALAWLMYKGAKEIHIYGADFVAPDSKGEVERCINFLDKNKWPDWTIFHMGELVKSRAPSEPGLDGFNFLLGVCWAMGIQIALCIVDNEQFLSTSLLDMDRPNYFYGYDRGKDPYFA